MQNAVVRKSRAFFSCPQFSHCLSPCHQHCLRALTFPVPIKDFNASTIGGTCWLHLTSPIQIAGILRARNSLKPYGIDINISINSSLIATDAQVSSFTIQYNVLLCRFLWARISQMLFHNILAEIWCYTDRICILATDEDLQDYFLNLSPLKLINFDRWFTYWCLSRWSNTVGAEMGSSSRNMKFP